MENFDTHMNGKEDNKNFSEVININENASLLLIKNDDDDNSFNKVTEKSESKKINKKDKKGESNSSRSSRKRKSVDYYALANPDLLIDKDNLLKNDEPLKKINKIEDDNEEIPNLKKQKTPEKLPKKNFDGDDNTDKKYQKTGNTKEMIDLLYSKVNFQTETIKKEEKTEKKCTPTKKGKQSIKGKSKGTTPKIEPESSKNETSDVKQTICAVCNKEIEKSNWNYHKQRYHNNLAWRIGETPLDLTNTELVKQILNGLYISKKLFYCENCDKSMKSVNGYLSHKSVCGKETETVKVPCKYCEKKMLPVSLPSHIRHYHEKKKTAIVTKPKKSTNIEHSKRKAAAKALKVIQHIKLESSGIDSNFMKHFEDLSFLQTNKASTMLHKEMLQTKNVNCKYPNCNFNCISADDLKQHLKFCMNKPDMGFVCKNCLFVQLTIADIIYHIETTHNIIIKYNDENSDETDSDNDDLQKTRQKNVKIKKEVVEKEKPLIKKTPSFLPTVKKPDVIFEKSYEWTLEFCNKNYTTKLDNKHFNCLKTNWNLMNLNDIKEYLPKMSTSCDVGFETVVDFQDVLHKDHTFKKFQIFESYLENNGNSTIFCGGPINSISWLPTPFNTKNDIKQFIAVATRNHPDIKYTNDTIYNEKCFIQFWNLGNLNNLETSMTRPRLNFCMSFEHGPIWDMQWCPSNCYDLDNPTDELNKLKRMGVLAVAGSDSSVYIYSIPMVTTSGQYFQSNPVLKLDIGINQEDNNKKFYASKMSWSKSSGHKYLAVGYTNGMVAIFHLLSDSKLLKSIDENNITTLLPIKKFQAHYHYISAISLYHLSGGCRWLLTGSYDRAVSLWDLKQPGTPIQTVKRNIVNDAIWMTNWLGHVIAYDEASTIGQASSVIQQARDFLSDPLYLFHCTSAITCLSGSDWLNGIIQANTVGEIFATFPKQLLINLSSKHMKNKKLLFGYTTLIEKDKTIEERLKENSDKEKALRNQLTIKTVIKNDELKTGKEVTHLDYNPHYYEYEPLVYHEVETKYGLLFCDHKMNSYSDFPPKLKEHMSFSSKMFGASKPNIYPLQAINKIELNPNRQASTYYITGYQAGFVRLTFMKFMNKDPQILSDTLELRK